MTQWKPIGQVAKDLGVSNRQLKIWSDRGLVSFEKRSGIRHFLTSEYPRIQKIRDVMSEKPKVTLLAAKLMLEADGYIDSGMKGLQTDARIEAANQVSSQQEEPFSNMHHVLDQLQAQMAVVVKHTEMIAQAFEQEKRRREALGTDYHQLSHQFDEICKQMQQLAPSLDMGLTEDDENIEMLSRLVKHKNIKKKRTWRFWEKTY